MSKPPAAGPAPSFDYHWISVDPGLRHTAVAFWYGDRLVRAALVKNPIGSTVRDAPAWAAMGAAVAAWVGTDVAHVVVEIPQIYGGGAGRGVNPDDLLQLAGVDGAILGALDASCTSYRPAAWKGQTPKEITQKRTEAVLSNTEIAAVDWPAPSLAHNVWDAIAIGLAHLRLTGRKRA